MNSPRRYSMPIPIETNNNGESQVGLNIRQPSFASLAGKDGRFLMKDGENISADSNPLLVFEAQNRIPLSATLGLMSKSLYGEISNSLLNFYNHKNCSDSNDEHDSGDLNHTRHKENSETIPPMNLSLNVELRDETSSLESDEEFSCGSLDYHNYGESNCRAKCRSSLSSGSLDFDGLCNRPRDRKSQIMMKLRRINASKWEDIGYSPPPMNSLPIHSLLSA
ncbi:hypothetical protein TRFO_25646 [Tritrichomonas foetus]|uniref:Uncharacterized protein n=1 Tax=Tritrichomonas foetus TaxID=1144522 RepID=A0A1J4K534_9EUKA|nr:hypothetical protein TRFO_25646 [Tritrichomonas foetus]|eukprot:OHT06307.1 hypothetical protein TRFO_25646 [Tritrichomonas foetus]